MDRTQTLHKLLDQLYLLPADRRERVLAAWPDMNDDVQEQTLGMLEEVFAKQNSLMTQIVKNDPSFPDKLQSFLDTQIAALRSDSKTDEASALASIEQKFS